MQTLKVILSSLDSLGRRLVKVYRYGTKDVQTPKQISPAGLDSVPIKDMIALYSKTDEGGTNVIVGYLIKNQKADIGELRIFSTDENGNEKFYTWLKNDGTCEIGGNDNNAIKYNEFKTEIDKLKSDHNDLIEKWNSFCTSYIPGGPTVVGSPPTLSTSTLVANSSDFANAKNDKIKTI